MTRDPLSVPVEFIGHHGELPSLAAALESAERVAIDTEVPIADPLRGQLRVMSVATRDAAGHERAFVVDARDVDPTLLVPLLRGVTADAWNASFDARVIDHAVYQSSDTTFALRWWDAQLADALLHQGRSGFTWFHGLAWATEHYLGFTADGKGTVQLSYTAYDDLTEAQIAYAGADAVETLWVGDAIRDELRAAGLETVCDLENEARPFLDQMERSGLPFDWPGWERQLTQIEADNRAVLSRLASLTGGGQGSLFDDVTEPAWNPASDQQLRHVLNTWAEPEVLAWSERRRGRARHLNDADSVNATVLGDIGGPLCEAMLEFRNQAKILSTYGESIKEHLHPDGRLRPQYLQVVGTNTGRLASRNPNAQNFTPRMKPFVRPASPDRVFVHADLSQAELRYLAQVSDDEPLRAAFARGEDVHVSTAATMFRFDPEELASSDSDRFNELRQIAKALNFGIAYGQGSAALAGSLTRNGTPTTPEEGRELLEQYRRTYPGTAAWAKARDGEIAALSQTVHRIDWVQSMRLVRHFAPIAAVRRALRKEQGRWPDAGEILTVLQRDNATLQSSPGARTDPGPVDLETVDWVLGYSAPVALVDGGDPFTFASRTLAGRRQQFNLHMDRLLLGAVVDAVGSRHPGAIAVRTRFATAHSLVLHGHGQKLAEADIAAAFDDRPLRRLYIEAIAAELGDESATKYLLRSASDRIGAMVNAWRNAPIQGGVADIMLSGYADLHHRLAAFPTATPVQTVHDSVVVECDESDAEAVAQHVREALERASLRFCPDVTPAADVDVRRSLASDTITFEL